MSAENASLRAKVQALEQALRESELRLNKFSQASAVLIDTFLLRPDGSTAIPYASPSIQEIWGVNPEDVAHDASQIFAKVHADDRDAMKSSITESARTMTAWHCEFRVQHPRKGTIWVEGSSIPEKIADGSILWHGILTDITSRKAAEQELRDTKERLELTYQLSGSGAWEWNPETQQTIWSEGLWTLYGIPPHSCEPSYDAWIATVDPDDRPACETTLQKAVQASLMFEMEWRTVGQDQPRRWLWARGLPVFDERGNRQRYRGIVLDITRRKNYELEIQALTARIITAQEEERQSLARDLHDDLAQQIGVLSFAVGGVKRSIPLDQAAAMQRSDQLQQKLVELSESVRRISRQLHPVLLQYSGLSAALKTYCGEFAELTGLRVEYVARGLADNLEKTVALQLYRIAQECLQNVLKHAQAPAAAVELRCDLADRLELTISDQGIGIDQNHAKLSGGLGLVSIHERARLIGGSAAVESFPGRGTTVRVIVKHPKRNTPVPPTNYSHR